MTQVNSENEPHPKILTHFRAIFISFILLVLGVSLLAFGIVMTTKPVAAANLELHWVNRTNIQATGGPLIDIATITFQSSDGGTTLSGGRGAFLVHVDNYNGYNFNCYISEIVTFKNNIIGRDITLTADTSPQPGSTRPAGSTEPVRCPTDWSGYKQLDGNYSTTNDQPSSGGGNVQESAPQRYETVGITFYLPNPPNTFSVILTPNGKPPLPAVTTSVKNKVTPVDTSLPPYYTYVANIPNVDPGDFKVCVKFDKDYCSTGTKTKGEVGSVGITLGKEAVPTWIKDVDATLTINPQVSDPTQTQTFGPFQVELRKADDTSVTTQPLSIEYGQQQVNDCNNKGLCGGVVFLSNTTTFHNIAPGDYKICLKDTKTCKSFTKVANDKASVELKLSAEDLAAATAAGKDKPTCTVEGIGWIVCPVLTFIAKVNDEAYKLIDRLLFFDATKLLGDPNTQAAWSAFRDLANIAFVIAIIIIIYSQLTGLGITNYGIKKLLPKVIIAAILVNISFYICEIAVDLSNVVGATIYDFFKNVPTFANGVASTGAPTWTVIVAGVIVGAIALVLLASVFGIAAMLAFALALLILVGRQALIILLIVISPLAFVAYLLPNTENLFKKWWSMFKAMLLVYPIVGVIFGASFLAAKILANGADQTFQLVALGVTAIPLFAVPVVLKGSLSALGAIGSRISGWQDRANRATTAQFGKSSVGRGLAQRKAAREEFRAQRFSGAMAGGGGVLNRGRRILGRGSPTNRITAAGRYARQRQVSSAVGAASKARGEAIDQEELLLSETSAADLMKEMVSGNGTVNHRAAVIRRLTKVGGDQHVQAAVDYMSRNAGKEGMSDIQQYAASAILSRKPAGLSGTEAGQLQTGHLSSGGYEDMLKKRIEQRKLGAADYAKMGVDDLRHLAEMSERGEEVLSPDDLAHIREQAEKIRLDETLKGTMTGEREALFSSILSRSGPMQANGERYDNPLVNGQPGPTPPAP